MCGHSKASLLEIHVVCLSSRLSVIQSSLVMLSYNYFSMGVGGGGGGGGLSPLIYIRQCPYYTFIENIRWPRRSLKIAH